MDFFANVRGCGASKRCQTDEINKKTLNQMHVKTKLNENFYLCLFSNFTSIFDSSGISMRYVLGIGNIISKIISSHIKSMNNL